MQHDPNCTRCELHKTCKTVCISGVGPTPCDIVIIGEAPGYEEDQQGKPFIGQSGQLLTECLEYAGVDRRTVYITNATRCRPPKNRKPKVSEIKACRHWLEKEISTTKPSYALLLGATALYALTGRRNLRESRDLGIFEIGDWNCRATYHPAYALRNPKAYDVIREDIKQFFKETRNTVGKFIIPYKVVNRSTWLDFSIWFNDASIISLDIETTGLDPYNKETKIVSIGLSDGIDQWIILTRHAYSSQESVFSEIFITEMGESLQKKFLITHNGKFDAIFLYMKYGITIYPAADTMLLYHLIDENGSLELKTLLSKVFPNFADYNVPTSVKSCTEGGSLREHCEYLAKDVYYTWHLFRYTKDAVRW